ncbi:MAG TPA: histidine phosphatase family protein [Candidatus Binatia bacterium]|jgi:probable phosphoglycerate mutase|nr:histidine phosphatase family protein [Candidatus Binatia bacterium]
MAIYLIRHGETDANAARVVQHPDAPLSMRGLEQADRLATRLRDAGIGHVLSSDLARARMTAERLAAGIGVPLSFDAGLHERNYGDVRGTPYAELTEDIFGPDYAPPGGETWDVFHARVDEAWARALAAASRTDGHLAVVTHGLVCRAVVCRHCRVAAEVASLRPWGNTSVTIVDGGAIRLLDCTAHLDGGVGGAAA